MSKTIQSRIQHSVYTAAVLKAKNPVLLKGEVVYESDTCKYKIGDGSTAWNTLPYGDRKSTRLNSSHPSSSRMPSSA